MYRTRLHFQLEIGRSWEASHPLEVGHALVAAPWELKQVTASDFGHGETWAIRSSPVATEAEARRAGELAQVALIELGLAEGFGISFSARSPTGVIFDSGIQMFAGLGDTVLRDFIGLQTYEDRGSVRFVSLNPAQVRVTSPAASVMQKWERYAQHAPVFDPRAALAFDLLSSSRSENSSRARFLLLVMAVESLVIAEKRPEAEVGLIVEFQKQLQATNLSNESKGRLSSALGNLKTESISRSAAVLMMRIGGVRAATLFKECYRLRSALVHGGDVVDTSLLSNIAADLEPLVRKAIAHRLH